MRYAMATYRQERDDQAYRIYVTDSLYFQGQNKYLNVRFSDLIKPKEVDERTGNEIALDVIRKLNLRFSNDECI